MKDKFVINDPLTRESAVQGIVEFIQEIYTEDTEEILLLAEKIVYDCKQSLEQGTYLQAYAKFIRGTKPNDDEEVMK